MGILIKRPVTVKVIMTEEFRQQLINEAKETVERIEQSLKNLEGDRRKSISAIELQNPQQASLLTQQLESEKESLIKMRAELEWRMKEVEGMELGVELPFRVFEGDIEINVGDNLLDKITKAEIVMKDWEVVEIRE